MARLNVKPTRMELNILKERLKTATRGHKLLKDKRDELMRRFIEAVRENDRLRQRVEAALVDNMQDFVMAKSLESDLMVEEIFAVPTREVRLDIEEENVMSVRVPKLHARIDNPYGDDGHRHLHNRQPHPPGSLFHSLRQSISNCLRT